MSESMMHVLVYFSVLIFAIVILQIQCIVRDRLAPTVADEPYQRIEQGMLCGLRLLVNDIRHRDVQELRQQMPKLVAECLHQDSILRSETDRIFFSGRECEHLSQIAVWTDADEVIFVIHAAEAQDFLNALPYGKDFERMARHFFEETHRRDLSLAFSHSETEGA